MFTNTPITAMACNVNQLYIGFLRMPEPTDKYKFCNHHHEIGERHEVVDFGDGEFVANKEAIPLLKALNDLGLRTRSHHIDDGNNAWFCLLLEGVELVVTDVLERDASRTKYNGKQELRISWNKAV